MNTRPGSPRAALRLVEQRKPLGRLIRCPGCGDDVDVIEVNLGGSFASMRPDLCGSCQPRARELEPVVDLPDPGRPMVGRYHAAGGDTERTAATAVAPRAGTQRARVLAALNGAGARGGLTDYELHAEYGIGVRPHVAGTRREELIADGWPIVDSGERRPTDTGAPAIVWKIENEGDVI